MIPEEILNKVSQGLASVVAKVSFQLWQEEKFRELIDFDNISQTEQDRIFNELEVSFLGLFYLYLDNLSLQLENHEEHEEKEITEQIKNSLKGGFLQLNRDLGIEEKFVKIWADLIDMRFKEYIEDFAGLMKEGIREKKLKDEKFRLFWARVQTITLDCLQHIRRGKLEEKDSLRKYLQEWVVNVDKIYSDAVKEMIFKPKAES